MANKKINNNGFEYVDLGLPSGTLWATSNVGAEMPSDAGLYFQWGDTKGYTKDQVGKDEGQKKFDLDDLNFKKYTTPGDKLELEDDAANANMGGDWHMPTPEQLYELHNNTTTAWIEEDGIEGMAFTSKKDDSKSIFIPAAGVADNDSMNNIGKIGYLWSSMLSDKYDTHGMSLSFFVSCVFLSYYYRYLGMPVRGVIG